ncbi:MAG TPA: PAS domain S-box protein, partial [Acidobacteria bacterium]|nr:PAS domain S-box protein [Acidobacteriota bacterium]
MRRHIRTTVTISVVVLVLTVGGVIAIRALRASLISKAVQSCEVWLPAVAGGRRQAVDDWLQAGLREAALIGKHPETARVVDGRIPVGRAVELLNAVAAAQGYRQVRIVDARGRTIATSTPGLARGTYHLPLAPRAGQGSVPVSLTTGPGGARFVVFRAAAGEGASVEILDHSVTELASMVAAPEGFAHDVRTMILRRGPGGDWLTLDSTGEALPAVAQLVRLVETSGPPGSGAAVSEILSADGRRVFAAALPIGGSGWWVVSTVDRRDVLAGAVHEALDLSWIIGIALALVLAVGLGLWRHQRSRHYRELASSEIRYRTLFESAPVSLWEEDLSVLKAELDRLSREVPNIEAYLVERPEEVVRLLRCVRVVAVNRASLNLYQASSESELSAGLDRLMTAESVPALATEMAALARGERQVSFQVNGTTLGGEPLVVQVHISIPPGPDGYESATVAVVDLTEREAALQRVEASEKRYRLLFDSAADAIFIHDFEGQVLDLNEVACRHLGYSRGELLAMRPWDFTAPEARAHLSERLEQVRAEGTMVFECTQLTRDGRRIPVEINARVVELEGREAVLSIVRDVSERRAALERITLLNRLLNTRSAVNRLTITERDRGRLLDGVCSILERDGGFGFAWILEGGAEDGPPQLTGSSDSTNPFLEAIREAVERDFWETPCGETLRTGRPTILNDLPGAARCGPSFEEAASENGYRSLAVFRVEAGGHVFGTLAICSTEAGMFGEEVQDLLQELANDMGFALEAMETREALARSEELYRLLAEQAQDIVYRYRLKPPVGFDYISPAVEAVLGYSPNEIMASPRLPLRTLYREDRRKALALLRGRVEQGRTLILRWVRRDGKIAWTENLNTIVVDENGEPEMLLGVGRDITERVRAEQRFRMLFDRNLAGVYRSAVDGRMIDCNEAFARIFGFASREELLQQTAWDLYPDRAVRRRFLAELWRERALAAYEQPMVRRDGSPLWIVLSAVMVPDEKGQLTEIEGTLMDLTERRQMEEELRATARRLEQAQRVAHVGNWEWDLERGQVFWSEEIYRIAGLEPRSFSVPFEEFLKLVHPEDVEQARRAKELALEGGEEYAIEYRMLRHDGSVRWVFDRAEVARDASGKPVRVFGTIQDVTERRALEEQLLHAQKMEAIGRLAGGVAHDFNNILQAMMMFGERLQEARGEDAVQILTELRSQMERAAALTRQLLLFSRQETSRLEELDLGQVVEGMSTMLRRLLRENIRFRVVPAHDALPLHADRAQLEQVLMNLVVNAADAMPGGGELEVRTGADPDRAGWARLEVEDSGAGIPEEIRERIFEPFFTTKPLGKGTGLGLSVVHGIVTGHGGTIEVDSGEDGGTVFRIFLPLRQRESGGRTSPSRRKPVPRGKGERLLLIEDHPVVRKSLVEALSTLGYRVLA